MAVYQEWAGGSGGSGVGGAGGRWPAGEGLGGEDEVSCIPPFLGRLVDGG